MAIFIHTESHIFRDRNFRL